MIIDTLLGSDYFLFTDSWHPTVNPSSRMPIHHLRYNELFAGRTGILTEVPRRYGGSTLREMIFSGQNLTVRELNTPIEWFPWWRDCDDPLVTDYIRNVISAGEMSNDPNAKSAYRDFFQRYLDISAQDASLTVGEAVNKVNNSICQEITGIIAPDLISFTKHRNYVLLLAAYKQIENDIYNILDGMLERLERDMFGMIAIITNYEGKSWRLRYTRDKGYFSAINIQDEADRFKISSNQILSMFGQKKLLPGSVLSCLLESIVVQRGNRIFHYGNTYGYFELIAEVLGLSQQSKERIGYFVDNADSWNFAEFIRADGTAYPIHLLDTWKRDSIHEIIVELIMESYESRRTITIPLRKDDSLESVISDRGSRLFW